MLVLGLDTCGSTGFVALGRLSGGTMQILSQVEIEGRTCAATLVSEIGGILARHDVPLSEVGCLVVVHGPGSFTGVRVGLSTAKGLSEGADIPVIAVSRLEVMTWKAGTSNAALDAHRHEVFLRIEGRELLAGAAELEGLSAPLKCVVCDPTSSAILAAAWPVSELQLVSDPCAADALSLAVPLINAREFSDIALLDGHYFRRSDAEIFGDPARAGSLPRT